MSRTWIALIALLAPFAAIAEPEAEYDLDIFEVRHRPAEELVPTLKPLLGEGGVITAEGEWILVRTLADILPKIEQAVERLDRPRQHLMLTLRREPDDKPNVRAYRTEPSDQPLQQRLHVMEGNWGEIRLGEAVPVGQQVHVADGRGDATVQSVSYLPLATTLEARARVVGDWVYLDIRPRRSVKGPHDGGEIAFESAATTIAGRLGEWLEVGAQWQESGAGANVISTQDRRPVRVSAKVERVTDTPQ